MSDNPDFFIENGVLIKYNGPGGAVVIPDGLTAIGWRAFEYCTGLTQVTLPDGLTEILGYAFSGCTNLKQVVFPDSLTEIGGEAFLGCTGLTKVVFPDGLTAIGGGSFLGCTGLRQVAFPDGLTAIGRRAFYGCTGLRQVVFPDSLTEIGGEAFLGCTDLTKVVFPDGLNEIGKEAFWGCTGLTQVVIPKSVTEIGDGIFSECPRLTELRVEPENPFVYAEGGALYRRDDNGAVLVNWPSACGVVMIPKGVTEIGKEAFQGCTGLTQAAFPDSLTEIGKRAFRGCTGLTQAAFPDSLTKIGEGAFQGCTGLRQVTFPDRLTAIERHAFKGCTGLTRVVIPEGVTKLEGMAFADCTRLTAVDLLCRNIQKINPILPEGAAVIRAPYLPLSVFDAVDKFRAVRGFAQLYLENFDFPEEIRTGYLKYIKSQKRRLYPLAVEDAALLNLMAREKVIPKGDVAELLEEAQAGDSVEVKAILLEYQNQGRQPKEAEKSLLAGFDLEGVDSLSPTEARKDWRYEKTEQGGIQITGYKGIKQEVSVPARIGDIPVTEIGAYAFSPGRKFLTKEQRQYRRQIRSVWLPEGVRQIAADAFEGCGNLTIRAPFGSFAEEYAKMKEIPFEPM